MVGAEAREASSVIYRIGSLEIYKPDEPIVRKVIYRIGSLEMVGAEAREASSL